MDDEKWNQIMHRAVETFGKEKQTMMLFEEISELQNAVCKEKRGRDSAEHIAEEMADVIILLDQMCIIYGIEPQKVSNYFAEKLLRLEERMDELQARSNR